jgi:ubiquitin carboxyl-terminal hydrolase L5
MDILNADLVLFRDMENWGKAKKYRKKRVVKRKKDDENEPGFHFIAYVPINGEVWKLDGLRRQPDNLGTTHISDHTTKWFALMMQRIISARRLDDRGCSTYQ